MADELIITGLRIPPPGESPQSDERGRIVVDAVVQTDFDASSQGAAGLSITDVSREIVQLCAGQSFRYLERAAARVVDGLMNLFPQIEGLEVTIRCLDPRLPGIDAESVGVRRRRHRERKTPAQRRKVDKPSPIPKP